MRISAVMLIVIMILFYFFTTIYFNNLCRYLCVEISNKYYRYGRYKCKVTKKDKGIIDEIKD